MVVPPKHPKMIIFSRKTPWLLGTTILGNPQIHKNHEDKPLVNYVVTSCHCDSLEEWSISDFQA